MPWSPPIPFRPGVNTVLTAVLNGSGWSDSNCIRFRDGIPEKNGGWSRLSDTTLTGVARGMVSWADLNGLPYAVFGTEQRLQLLSLYGISDITPLRATTNPAINFSTVLNSKTVTIVDAGAPATLAVGDWVNINVPVSIGGIVLQGLYQVTGFAAPPAASPFTIAAATLATSTVNNAGAVPKYTVTNTSATVTVTLNNHGLVTADPYINQVGFTLATVVIGSYSQWFVSNVVDANNFQFLANSAANANNNVFENSGNAQLLYLIPTGFSNANLLAGFGVGLFGAGFFGTSNGGATYTVIRQWFMDHWGQDWIGNYPASPIYVWVPPPAGGNVAIAIDTTNFPSATSPPAHVNVSFVTMPQQILMALGCDPSGGGTQDNNLIRWCNVADFTDWVASATNQAGSFRIPTGSRLVGGIAGATFGAIWTDVDMYLFAYIGFPLVFSFNRLSSGSGLLSGRCVATAGGMIYFVAPGGIYRFDGSSASIVPCPVWDTMWRNINRVQVDKCFIAVNSPFNEFAVFFQSKSGTDPNTGLGEVDCYIRFNYRDNLWDIGAIGTLFARTCAVDENVFGPPIGVAVGGLIQQQEVGTDADGALMGEFITSGYFSIDNGWLITIINQVVSDMKYEGVGAGLIYYILTKNYPKDTPVVYGPFTDTISTPEFETINARGRMMAVSIGMSTIGSWWRLGWFRYLYQPDGSL